MKCFISVGRSCYNSHFADDKGLRETANKLAEGHVAGK